MDLPEQAEIAVVGGGPAGAACAAALARRGREVVLLEKDRFPRDKVCGEFLSTEVVDALERLGCLEEFLALQPPVMTTSRLVVSSGRSVEFDLPGRAYGLSRWRLDEFLFAHAHRCGAQTVEQGEVKEITCLTSGGKRLVVDTPRGEQQLRADVVVGAWGRRSGLDRKLDRPFFAARTPLVGLKRHYRPRDGVVPAGLEGVVELHIFDGGYCGVSYVEGGEINVCTLFDQKKLSGRSGFDRAEFWKVLVDKDSSLARRMEELEPCERPTCSVAQVSLTSKEVARDGLFFVGDTAGMIAPLAGDGQAMAIEAGLELGGLLDEHLPEIPARQWQIRWHRRYAVRLAAGRLLQRAMVQPALASPALAVLERWPVLGEALARVTRG